LNQPPNQPTAQGAEQRNQSWQLLTFLFALANFLEVAVMAHFVLFTPAFLDAIGFSQADITTWTGPIASAGFLSGIWFVPFWGVLADRYGRKPLILRSYYVEVVAMVLAALAYNVWLYLIGRALTGLALGNTGLMYAALTETAPRNRVAFALGLVNGSAPLGSLVGALAGGFLVSQFGVHFLFGVDAVIAGLIAIVLTVFYRDVFVPKPTPHVVVMLRDALRAVIDSPVASTIFLVSFVSSAAFFFSFSYLPVRIGEIVGVAASAAAIGITQGVAGATTLFGSAFLGLFADRIGHRRLLVVLMLIVTILWLPMYAAQSILGVTLVWAAFNAFSPSVSSLMFTIISLNVPAEKRGSVLSMIYLPMNLAFVVGPITASFVAQVEVRDVFLVSAALSLLALLIFVVSINRTRVVGEHINVATE
jgi:DHA1 family multidrug resistance protein-like MFS transporter